MSKKKQASAPKEFNTLDELYAAWDSAGYRPSFANERPVPAEPPRTDRTWGEAISDTGAQLAEGVNTIAGAIPNLVAPKSDAAGFFRDNAEFWKDKQSDPMKRKLAQAESKIAEANQDSIIEQAVAAVKAHTSDPALAMRLITTNLPSLIPGIGAAKLAQAAKLASGASAVAAAATGTTAAGVTNAVLNAGGARGEAYEDVRDTLIKQGHSREEAEQIALDKSLLPAAVGGAAGFASGKSGLEKALLNGGLAKGGAGAAARAVALETMGEQAEEVLPQVMTNYQASEFDQRPLSRNVGRTAAETLIASAPGGLVSGALEGRNHEARPQVAPPGDAGSEAGADPAGAPLQLGHSPDPLIVFPDGTIGRRAEVDAYIAGLPEEQQLAARAKLLGIGNGQAPGGPQNGWTTQPGAANPDAAAVAAAAGAQPPTVRQAPDAPNFSTQAGAAPERGAGIDFRREVDTGDLALTDPQADARARAATIDYEQPDRTPNWDTAPGASPGQARGRMMEMSADIDTANLALQSDEEHATSSRSKVFDPSAVTAKTWPQFVVERGEKVSTLRKDTPAWDRLQNEWAALKNFRAGAHPEGTGSIGAPTPEIQNRDRARPASVVQMQGMAQKPDYLRLGVSRTPESGAPMAFANGDQVQAAHAWGRADTAVMSDGQRVPFQYAVMEAADVQPSNFADGNANPLFASEHPGVVKALNNGRTAGLRAAYERGTAEDYKRELMADSEHHGIAPEVIAGMKAPMLVRLYSQADNRTNMGAKSQSQALGLSAAEQAATDASLVDGGVLEMFDAGALDSAGNADFARAFVGKLQAEGQDVAGMLDAGGALSPAGVTRLQAALVHKAYGDGDLVESMFGSTDNDIRAIGEALKSVAGEWANLRNAAEKGAINPSVDVTGNLLQAVRMVQKARRERASLYDAAQQVDMLTGEVPDPNTIGVLRLLYSGHYLTRALGRDRMAESLREYMGAALATRADADMFGEQVGPESILAALSGQPIKQPSHDTAQAARQQPATARAKEGERVAHGGNPAGSGAVEPGQQARRQGPDRAGQATAEDGRGREGQDAEDSSGQPDREGAQGDGEDGRVAVAETADDAQDAPLFSRTPETKQAYESRIDALFSGESPSRTGAKVLDSSDVLGLLGHPNKPVTLVESKVGAGLENHPAMTAEVWKKVPEWIENPAAVFNSDTDEGLVFIAPELVQGRPVSIILRPDSSGRDALNAHLLVNAYDRSTSTPFGRWMSEGLTRYIDKKEFPALYESVVGRRLPDTALQNKPGTAKILTEKQLGGYRRANTPANSRGTGESGMPPEQAWQLLRVMGNPRPTAEWQAQEISRVQAIVDPIRKLWVNGPKVEVIHDIDDPRVPDGVRKAEKDNVAQGAGAAEGFYYQGQVFLIASRLSSPKDVLRVFFHEALGHHGLRGAFGQALNGILRQMVRARPAQIVRKLAEYKLEDTPENRLLAAEEVLVNMAETQPELGFVRRAVAAIRSWLRANVPGFTEMRASDDEIIRDFILPARQWVKDGASAARGSASVPLAAAMSRTEGGNAFDKTNDIVIADFVNDQPLKRHPDYKAAKAGDALASIRLVQDLVKPQSLEQAREKFGSDAVFVPVQAVESKGMNNIPNALAMHYANALGASVTQDIKQNNKAFHTGAGPMERLANRAEFDGKVMPGKRYVLVDDVTTMGSTLADMAAYIQRNGGQVVGSVVMTNAMRGGKIASSPKTIKQLEARHGQAISDILGIDADQLTGPEAQYLIGFKTTDEIRTRATRSTHERVARLDAKTLPERQANLTDQSDDAGGAPLFSLSVDALAKAKAQWSALVDQFVRGGLDESRTYDVLPSSTAVMRMMGLPDLPIRTSTHSLDALYNHGVKPSQLKSVLDQLANPQLVMVWNRGSRGEMSLNFVTNMENAQGLPLVIALKPNRSARQGRNHWLATITEKQPDSILEMLKSGGGLYVGGGEIAGITAENLRAAMRYAKEKQGSEARGLVQAIGTNDSLPNLVQRVLYAKDLDKFKSEMQAGDTPMFSRKADIEHDNKPGNSIREKLTNLGSQPAPSVSDGYTALQQRAAERAFGAIGKQSWADRANAMRANFGTKLRQGLVDQFAPIKEVSEKAYILARLSKGSDGAVEAALMYGKPFLRDGVADVDVSDGGFAKVLASLKGEHDRFFQWVAAQRGERLKSEGKENLLTDADISALKTLNCGQFTDGVQRAPVYQAALRQLNLFNEATLQLALESGLMDQAAFDLMKDQPYVPFYRLMDEDGGMRGPRFSSGLVNQQAWKKLKGGTQQINADLLQNTLMNWSHLYSAAARNRASLETMAAAEGMGVAYPVSADTKGAVKVMRDGVAEHWAVEDPHLLDAISAMSYAPGGLAKAMAPFKRLLTFGVTVNPTFKIRNLIRDSLSAMAQSDLSYNPLANVAKGWKATAKDSQTYASMLASGGIIQFGSQEKNTNHLRDRIAKLGGVVLDDSGWGKLKGQMKTVWDAYEEFGDRTENVNRAALYERLMAKGHSHAQASFMARDLMDFSMSGKWEVVRFLTQTVPFLNARLQGLYKLGRAAQEDPRRFAAMAGAVSLASLGLLAAYGDDDDWKKREDWDRDNYWWFKIGGTAFRIPKPFEVGAIGTVAERTAELMFSKEMTGKRFGARISDMVFNTFAMDPTPQAIKPFLDVYANKDSFSGRAIEGMSDERLRPQDRYNERTSEVARLLGSWGLPDPVRLIKGEYAGLSPKQVDFLMRGYLGWLATVTTTATDTALRPLLNRGERPALRLRDTFLAGNFVESLPTGSSRYVTAMYEQSRDIEQAWASYQEALKTDNHEKAQAIRKENASQFAGRTAMTQAKTQMADLSRQAKRIESSKNLNSDTKRERLTAIEERKHQIAKRVSTIAAH